MFEPVFKPLMLLTVAQIDDGKYLQDLINLASDPQSVQ